MGTPISQNLKKNGFEVKGYDIMPAVRLKAKDAVLTVVNSLAEVAKNVDFEITALSQTQHVLKH